MNRPLEGLQLLPLYSSILELTMINSATSVDQLRGFQSSFLRSYFESDTGLEQKTFLLFSFKTKRFRYSPYWPVCRSNCIERLNKGIACLNPMQANHNYLKQMSGDLICEKKMPNSNRLSFKLRMAFDGQGDIKNFNPSVVRSGETNESFRKILLVLKIRN